MKILALDLGDQWVGSALSDSLRITAQPYQTISNEELLSFLRKTIDLQHIKIIVIGYPKTLRGTESQQTKKVVLEKKQLEKLFPEIEWILWDERLSSKHAEQLKKTKKKEDKKKSHSIAAAFILQTYLDYLHFRSTL